MNVHTVTFLNRQYKRKLKVLSSDGAPSSCDGWEKPSSCRVNLPWFPVLCWRHPFFLPECLNLYFSFTFSLFVCVSCGFLSGFSSSWVLLHRPVCYRNKQAGGFYLELDVLWLGPFFFVRRKRLNLLWLNKRAPSCWLTSLLNCTVIITINTDWNLICAWVISRRLAIFVAQRASLSYSRR